MLIHPLSTKRHSNPSLITPTYTLLPGADRILTALSNSTTLFGDAALRVYQGFSKVAGQPHRGG